MIISEQFQNKRIKNFRLFLVLILETAISSSKGKKRQWTSRLFADVFYGGLIVFEFKTN